MRTIFIIILTIIVLYGVGVAVLEMPDYGEKNPTFNFVYNYYITHGVEETGAVNVVTQILADYRAYDTLIETVVLFAAIMAAILVLKTPQVEEEDEHGR